MNTRTLKKPEKRVEMAYNPSLDIKAYGYDNLYPQNVQRIVSSSPTGNLVIGRRANYIEGDGLRNRKLAEAIVNREGERMDDIHALCSADLAMFEGFALHINYDALGRIVSLAHIPFENVRLAEPDEYGYVGEVAVHIDWSGTSTLSGKKVAVTKSNIERIRVFDPRPEVVAAQIEAVGGIDKYNGQVLYISRAGRNRYAEVSYDGVLTDMSTDEGIANVDMRNVRNNFMPAGMLITKKGQSLDDDRDEGYDAFAEEVVRLQGDTNACKILHAEIDYDENRPEFVPFESKNLDKQFERTAPAVVERIYAALHQEAFHRLRSGSIGFSGELVHDVKLEYCQAVARHQRTLSRAYVSIFERWAEGSVYTAPSDCDITPLVESVTDTAV